MILITGGGGFLGLNVASCLAEKGREVLILQRRAVQPPPFLAPYWGKQVRQVTGSVLSLPYLLTLARSFPLQGVIHAAFDSSDVDVRGGGIKPSSYQSLYEVVESGIVATMNILEVARLSGFSRVTFVSSVDTYRGVPKDCPEWREDAFLPPVAFSPVCNLKKSGEQICLLYHRSYGLSVVSLRVGRLYGPAASHAEPIRIMTESVVRGLKPEVSHVAASSRGHTIYAKDAGEATALLHMKPGLDHQIYNVADGDNPTMGEAAQILKELVPGSEIRLGQATSDVPSHSGIHIERLKAETGFAPRKLREGLAAYVDYLKSGTY